MRKRYVQQPDGTLVEVGKDFVQTREQVHVGALWGDRNYDGLRAPDGTPIDSRTKHRQYMKDNNLTIADDYKGEWAKAAKEKAEILKDGGDHKQRKRDLVEAVHKLQAQGRR
jgi:hypothetical protein